MILGRVQDITQWTLYVQSGEVKVGFGFKIKKIKKNILS